MGRALLVVVILMSTIFAAIVVSMQKNLLKIPDIITYNMVRREAENVSDFALRKAVARASFLGASINPTYVTNMTESYNNLTIGSTTIDSVRFSFNTSTQKFRAVSYVRGEKQGITLPYQAEIAFNFPISQIMSTPNCFYYEFNQPQFHGANEYIRDSSPNQNTGEPMNHMGTRPHGGADSWKYAYFDGVDDYIRREDHPSLRLSGELTLVVFAKIDQGRTTSSLVWIPSNPYDTGVPTVNGPGHNLRYKPTAGIWFTSSPKQINFGVTHENNVLTVATFPFVPDGKWPHNKDPWHFFAMTYNRNTRLLKGYYNGLLVTTVTATTPTPVKENTYGFQVGRRDIRVLGSGGNSEYMYMKGGLDQGGLWNRELSAAEIFGFYYGVINPADVLYIRD